jgi:hypothetical protein
MDVPEFSAPYLQLLGIEEALSNGWQVQGYLVELEEYLWQHYDHLESDSSTLIVSIPGNTLFTERQQNSSRNQPKIRGSFYNQIDQSREKIQMANVSNFRFQAQLTNVAPGRNPPPAQPSPHIGSADNPAVPEAT